MASKTPTPVTLEAAVFYVQYTFFTGICSLTGCFIFCRFGFFCIAFISENKLSTFLYESAE